MHFQWTTKPCSGLRGFCEEKRDRRKRRAVVCHGNNSLVLPAGCPAVIGEDLSNVEYGDRKKHQRTYLDGLKRYKNKGVRITIDGVECPEKEWEKIFEMGEDGGFYMGDYVGAEQGCLKEIRFDKVYLSDPPKEKRIRIHEQTIKADNENT